MKNRLNLDFNLSTNTERIDYINNYISTLNFTPTSDELEMMGNYILWGRGENDKNSVQNGEVEIETRNKAWNKSSQKPDSLDELLETPTFNEGTLYVPGSVIPLKNRKETFNREEALAKAPLYVKKELEALFRQIDETELTINLYEISTKKRVVDPRASLLNRFTKSEIETLKTRALTLTPFKYLKLRHFLIELRSQQYTLRDSFIEPFQPHYTNGSISSNNPITFDSDIPVYPLGLRNNSPIGKLIFKDFGELSPKAFSEEDVARIIKFYWKKEESRNNYDNKFDFREIEHVYNLIGLYKDIEEDYNEENLEDSSIFLVRTLDFYVENANLSDLHRDIYEAKKNHVKNVDIRIQVNKKYNRNYTDNYISTIFRQRIIPQICATSSLHMKIVGELSFPENFKKCKGCGRNLLVSEDFFVRKGRSKDGFASKCKACDKVLRELKKEAKN